MYKIFTFGLIFSLVVQPVVLSAPTLAAQDLGGDFSNVEVGEQTELVEGAEVLEEAVIEETEISEEFVADETPLSDIDEASGEMATGDNVDQIEEKEADDVSPEVPSDESGPTEEQVYISKVYSKDGEEFIEIYNSGDDIKLERLNLYRRYTDGNDDKLFFKLPISGILLSGRSMLIHQKKNFDPKTATEKDIDFDFYFTGNTIIQKMIIVAQINESRTGFCSESSTNCGQADKSGEIGLQDRVSPEVKGGDISMICLAHENVAKSCNENADRTYYTLKPTGFIEPRFGGFIPDTDTDTDMDIDPNPSTDQPPDPVQPKNACENLKLNEIAANVDEQFIEIMNSGKELADLNGCVIQTNKPGDKSHIFKDNIELAPGELYVLEISNSDLVIVKTTKRTVYLLSEDGETEIDNILYQNLKKDTSWSRFLDGESGEDVWKQTYALTPGEGNLYDEFPACEVGFERNLETGRCRKIVDEQVLGLAECPEGQYRNLETNRCRKIETLVSTLTPCGPNQYRHPETNRCRNLESLVSASLTPCKAGQYRHPETNRCRNIPVASTPTPCKDGYERNPETNRCRKIVTNTGASNSVSENSDESAKEFTGWLAIGGVGLLTAGVVGWEWKREIYGLLKSMGEKFRPKRRR